MSTEDLLLELFLDGDISEDAFNTVVIKFIFAIHTYTSFLIKIKRERSFYSKDADIYLRLICQVF